VTSIWDAANDRIFHNQQVVDPGAEYRYDALYRLAAARGREHRAGDAQVAADAGPWTVSTLPNDGQALRNYVETYVYDSVGNVLAVRHHEGFNLGSPPACPATRRTRRPTPRRRGTPRHTPTTRTAT
jgi:hypothetical protein